MFDCVRRPGPSQHQGAPFHELRLVAGSRYLADEITCLQFIDRFDDAQTLLSEVSVGVAEHSPTAWLPLIRRG